MFCIKTKELLTISEYNAEYKLDVIYSKERINASSDELDIIFKSDTLLKFSNFIYNPN